MIAFAGWEKDWPYVAAPFLFYFFTVFWLLVTGTHGDLRNPVRMFFRRISTKLEEITGYPGWAMAGALSGLLVLAEAAMGLYWDIAYHVDYGRDKQLFTPSHVMILLGLGGLVYAAVIAVIFVNNDEKTDVGFRVGGLQVPWSALMMAALGVGGVAAFPLDNLWHQAYGIDVTLWSPTHLQLVAGGSLGTIAVLLMLLEGRRDASPTWLGSGINVLAGGALLVGLTTFEGEFDFGVPQFQGLYLPILFAIGMGFGLVLSRLAIGKGGAISSVFVYLILRGTLLVLVGGSLHHTPPRFPLYLVGAAVVEGVALWLGTHDTLRFAAVAGALVGTVGVFGEMVWVDASGWFDLHGTDRLPLMILLSLVGATAASLLGAGLGRSWRHGGAEADSDATPIPLAALGVAGLAIITVLAIPLPRNVGHVDSVIRLEKQGDKAIVSVALTPANAAKKAAAFGVMAWQGGGTEWAPLKETGPGQYVTTKAVPITGKWKAMVSLQRGSQVMAAPVYLPADPEIGASAIPAIAERHTPFVRNTSVLLREAKDGPAGPAIMAYTGVGFIVVLWIGLFAFTGYRLSEEEAAAGGPPPPGYGVSRPTVQSALPLQPAYTRTWATR